jgi:hypothetical protein
MPHIELHQNTETGEIVLVPFAWDETGNRASGPMIRMTREEFLANGPAILNQKLLDYYHRDPSVESELYQLMPKDARRMFLRNHRQIFIDVRRDSTEARVFLGKTAEFYGAVVFPLDEPTIAQYVLDAFWAAR